MSHVTDKLYHIVLYRAGFEFATLVVIGTDCIGSYKSNYYTMEKGCLMGKSFPNTVVIMIYITRHYSRKLMASKVLTLVIE